MKTRMEVLRDLLFELDDICRNNGLKYTLTGTFLDEAVERGDFPELYDYINVAMTRGDIDRFIHLVNGKIPGRQVEYFLNNPYARGLQYRYCNSNTTLINIKGVGNHVNYGFYIRMIPINDASVGGRKGKVLKFSKAAWKGSTKTLASSVGKRKAQVMLLKGFSTVVGKERWGKWLFEYNDKLRRIDRWEDISHVNRITIARARFTEKTNWEIKNIELDGRPIMYAEELLERRPVKEPTHNTVVMNEIENTEIPYTEVMNSDEFKEIFTAKEYRDEYLKVIVKADKPTKYLRRVWNIYLMTRDVVDFRDTYNEEMISKIKSAIDEKNEEQYYEYMQPYLRARRKWKRLRIPFLPNDDLERIIAYAKVIFNE